MLLKHHAGFSYDAQTNSRRSDVMVYRTGSVRRGRYRDKGLYRENAIAIESEAIGTTL